jgi:hypothetical protein
MMTKETKNATDTPKETKSNDAQRQLDDRLVGTGTLKTTSHLQQATGAATQSR